MQLGAFKSCVKVGGVALQEFEVETSDDGTTAICWIPSELGKNFSIHYSHKTPTTALHVRVKVDGQKIPRVHKLRGPGHPHTESCSYMRMTATLVRPLEFSKLGFTDANLEDTFGGISTELGVISVSFSIAKLVHNADVPSFTFTHPPLSTDPVSERSKKAGAHRVALGVKTEKRFHPSSLAVKPIGDKPNVTFIFHYRPLDLLIANGIAPPSTFTSQRTTVSLNPACGKAENDSDIEVLTMDEADLKRIASRKIGKRASVEGSHRARQRPRKRLKVEDTSHESTFTDDEVIDLTQED